MFKDSQVEPDTLKQVRIRWECKTLKTIKYHTVYILQVDAGSIYLSRKRGGFLGFAILSERKKAFGREQEQKIWYHDFLLFANLNNKRATKPVQVRQNEVWKHLQTEKQSNPQLTVTTQQNTYKYAYYRELNNSHVQLWPRVMTAWQLWHKHYNNQYIHTLLWNNRRLYIYVYI